MKERMQRLLIVTMALFLTGCASSGPVSIGKDTYLITKQGAGGVLTSSGSVKVDIIREAQLFCTSTGKAFQIVNTNEQSAAPGRLASAEVQFMCLNEGDQELRRPKLSRAPDTVIEVRK